jgi:hypothetical protein
LLVPRYKTPIDFWKGLWKARFVCIASQNKWIHNIVSSLPIIDLIILGSESHVHIFILHVISITLLLQRIRNWMFIDVKKIIIRKWCIALYWKFWIVYTRLITHCPIQFNKEKGPHPLFLSLKFKWKSSYDVWFFKTLVGEKHIVQYDKNDVNGSWCGQEANNNKNMKGYWDKQHRGSTCSCRLQDGNK